MLVLKMSAAMLAAMLLLSPAVIGASFDSDRDDDSYDDDNIVLPTSAATLFADVYNNNSITLELKAREPQYISTPSVVELAPGTFMAINFAMGNSLWVVTPENTIIVFDVPESNEASDAIRKLMRQQPAIGTKPITFIVYTIFQGDHTFGSRPLIEDEFNNGKPPVIVAHKNMIQQAEFFDTFSFIKMNRVLRVFGSLLPPSVSVTAFTPLRLGAVRYLEFYPSVLLDLNKAGDTQDLILNGLPFKVVYIPGYTEDQLGVWFPTTKVIHAADIFYALLPNIYTIRGEPARDAMAWSNTARIIQSYNAEVLYASHGHPLYGKNYIYNLIGKTADIMQYIHDQTVRLLGKGYTPDVVSRMIKLPRAFTSESELGEYYGAVEGHSKAIADHYTGWFNGEAEDLVPISKPDLAKNMVRDFGREKIMEKARKAYKSGDYRWALTLSTHVWRYENKSLNDALYWRTQSIKRLAENLSAVQWRNYLFTEAMVNWKVLPNAYLDAMLIKSRLNYMVLHTLENCFTLLSVHLNAQLADGVDKTIDLSVANDPNLQPGQVYRLRIYNSVLTVNKVAAVDPLNPTSFPSFQTNNTSWRQILSGLLTIDQALAANTVSVVRGTSNDIKGFLAYFDFVDQL